MYIFEIAYLMIKRELTARYRGTIFGYLWSLLNPLAFALVYFIAFKYIVRIPVENYSVFLLCGLFPWIWISSSIITESLISEVEMANIFMFSSDNALNIL